MKKFFYFVTILLVACASNDDYTGDSLSIENEASRPQESLTRSVDDAMKIAQQSLAMLDKASTRAENGSKRKIDLASGVKTIVSKGTRSDGNGRDTLMYVFNFEDNNGFAIVAAPRSADGLIAITESGHYEPDVRSEIEGFEMFMDMAERYISEKMTRDPIILIDSVVCIGHSYVGPYVTVRWGQIYPEGEFCPNGKAGCLNTALAQIMSYFQYPQSISLTYPNADKTTQQLNWTAMKAHPIGHQLSICNTTDTATHASISRLCRQLGEMNHSSYASSTGTYSASTVYAQITMPALGYQTSVWYSYSESYIRSMLNNGKVMLFRGKDDLGHAWVADGYDTATYQLRTYAHPVGSSSSNDWIVSMGDPYTVYLYHFNWGWYGFNNGYFNGNVFNTAEVLFPDTVFNSVTHNYNQGVAFLVIWL